ncbi:aspartate aminotransferase family protein [bacterium]|nr:aspartate aminotransferase family protein [bacterium]
MEKTELDKYLLPTYNRYPITFVKAKGMKVWDENGIEYLDFFPGWGVGNVGHCHPKVVSAIKEQAGKVLHVPNIYYSLPSAELAKYIVESSFDSQVFFCNSGAEANEGAIKLARKRNESKFEIISLKDSFHGRTLATLTATGQPKYQQGFAPLPEGFKYCDINDCNMLESLFNEKTAGLILECVQGEGGINIVSHEFMQKARELCDKFDALLILDEVQTGIGRTGKMFGYQNYDVVPDVMTLAKALGGGMPIGALVVKKELNNILVPGTHASTFGGNAVCCAAGIGVFKAIEQEGILADVSVKGAYILKKLNKLKKKYPIIKDVRGVGLMIGVELNEPGAKIVDKCREKKLLINCTHENVLRLMPALNVKKKEINHALGILEGTLLN